ncbi:hypothetical protein [Pedobacter sp.]|uniref:hypothetical protein n=1 Tax=Pedobacter sp. TaxID=1411316 RepID=UPI00396C5E7A
MELLKKSFYCFLLSACFIISCKEFIERPLDNKQIRIIAPANHVETNSYQLTFWWETHPDAFQYRLQVVSPDFSEAVKFILDTVVRSDKFTYTLEPGNYQWRVRGENGSSATLYTTGNFVVHPSSLKEQVVQLVAPAQNQYTSNPLVQYEWLKLFGATQYRLQIDDHNFSDEQNLVVNALTDNLTYMNTLVREGTYQFRVRAEKDTEISKWSAVRSITYDATAPAKVILISPANKQAISKPVTLTWNPLTDAEKYEVYVYKSDSVTLYNSGYPQIVNNNSLVFNQGNVNETLVWRVRAIDKAGNKGEMSDYFTFTLR